MPRRRVSLRNLNEDLRTFGSDDIPSVNSPESLLAALPLSLASVLLVPVLIGIVMSILRDG